MARTRILIVLSAMLLASLLQLRHRDFNPVVKEVEKPKSEKEIRDEYETMKNRISYLEAEVARRDARIKELEEKLPK